MTTRQKMTRYLTASSALIGLIAWAVYAGFPASDGSVASGDDEDARPLAVSVTTARPTKQIQRTRAFTGELRAARTSQLSFEQSGRIVRMLVDEGDSVAEGELLAEIELDQTASRLASAQAAVAQAQARLEELEAGPRKEAIASAKANVLSLDADVARLQADFERSERLIASNSISQERFDTIRFQHDAAIARRDASQRQLDELVTGTRPEQLAAQRATLARLRADQQAIEQDLADAKLTAPYAGSISQRFLDEGTVVSPGQATIEIVENGQLEAWVGVSSTAASQLEFGAEYVGEVQDQTVHMTLRSLRPQLDLRTRTQNAVFEVEQTEQPSGQQSSQQSVPTATLVPGQIVRLKLKQTVRANGFVLPTSALVPGPRGLWSVYVVRTDTDSFVEQRDVTLIETLGTRSLVKGTLEAGMQIIMDGTHRVVPGQKVSPQIAEASAVSDAVR